MDNIEFNKKPLLNNFVEVDDKIWFWDIRHNGLYFCDKKNNYVEGIELECYKTYDLSKGTLYSKLCLYKKSIIAVPWMAEEILIINVGSYQERYIKLKDFEWDENALKRGKFWDVVCMDEFAYFIGYGSSCLLKFNLEEEVIEAVVDLYQDRIKVENKVCFKFAGIMDKNLIIPACIDNIVFIVNADTLQFSIKCINPVEHGFSAIHIIDDQIWLSPRRVDPIVCWDIQKDSVTCYNEYPKNFELGDSTSMGSIERIGEKLYFFPLKASAILELDLSTGRMDVEKNLNAYIRKYVNDENQSVQKYCLTGNFNGTVYAYSRINNCFIWFDPISGEVGEWELQFTEKEYDKFQTRLVQSILRTNQLVNEGEIRLIDFVNYIQEQNV